MDSKESSDAQRGAALVARYTYNHLRDAYNYDVCVAVSGTCVCIDFLSTYAGMVL